MKIVDMRIATIVCDSQVAATCFIVPPNAFYNDFGSVALNLDKCKAIPESVLKSPNGFSVPDGYRFAYNATLIDTISGTTSTTMSCIGASSDITVVKITPPLRAGDAVGVLFTSE